MTVVVAVEDGNRLAFKITPNFKLNKLFHEYCQRKQYDLRTARFFHEGHRLPGKYTAAKFVFLHHESEMSVGYVYFNIQDRIEAGFI
ncbi:hypothetical protein PVK06_032464 [Gossypium arboreum]|uniref:Rad60/SUMO-like domain-containing protein n=1 Tax=Gossypium arboreum TaxID=29729 RepID=A0ABR0NTZ3_GOSAR|nr:hypothetical protein PVK06_032464 [Gossypium arboreum]